MVAHRVVDLRVVVWYGDILMTNSDNTKVYHACHLYGVHIGMGSMEYDLKICTPYIGIKPNGP